MRREYEQNGVPGDRLRTVYNGVDVQLYAGAGDPAAVRAALGVAPDEPHSPPGEAQPLKGQAELIEAMPGILQRFPRATFVYAGADTSELGGLPPVIEGQPSVRAVLERRVAALGLPTGPLSGPHGRYARAVPVRRRGGDAFLVSPV